MDDPSYLETVLARELRRAIALDGRSLNSVGRAAGFSQGYLSQLLRGRQDLKVRHVMRVLAALEVPPETYFRRILDALGEPARSGAGAEPGEERGATAREGWSEEPAADENGTFEAQAPPGEEALRQTVRDILRQELPRELLAEVVREHLGAVAAGDLLPAAGRSSTVDRGHGHRDGATDRLHDAFGESGSDEAGLSADGAARELFRGFLLGELDPDVADELEGHVDQGCLTCLSTIRELASHVGPDLFGQVLGSRDRWRPGRTQGFGGRQTTRRNLCRILVVENERQLAPALVAKLDRYPRARRGEIVRSEVRFQLHGLAAYLAEESRQAGFRDVARAQELGELGVEVASSLDPSIYGASVVLDRQALSRAFLANARRVAGDLVGAERAFQDALFHLERGSGSEVVRADVLSLLGSLRTDQARYDEARRALEEALDFFRRFGQREDEGKVLFQLAKVSGYAEEAQKAVALMEEAMPLIDEEGGDRLKLLVRHGLSVWLLEAGDPLEALARFEKAKELYDRFGDDPWFQLRRRWQEARIHTALGDTARAEPLFEEVRQAATERELPYELAMINLELAILHLDQGETAKVRQLAEEMVPIFRSRELHAHAQAAVYLFQHAARTETATTGLAREVLGYLRRAQNNPYLPFR